MVYVETVTVSEMTSDWVAVSMYEWNLINLNLLVKVILFRMEMIKSKRNNKLIIIIYVTNIKYIIKKMVNNSTNIYKTNNRISPHWT